MSENIIILIANECSIEFFWFKVLNIAKETSSKIHKVFPGLWSHSFSFKSDLKMYKLKSCLNLTKLRVTS